MEDLKWFRYYPSISQEEMRNFNQNSWLASHEVNQKYRAVVLIMFGLCWKFPVLPTEVRSIWT
jgi:hypothetical protein